MMPRWTEEQLLAINEDHSNIIVSAGAGSGKTAVLSERVIRKLQDGVSINHLLLLTFTKAASLEMKERIRDKISKIPSLSKELDLIDSSYITTFDSFALSVVKRYHYLLNISNNPKIADQSIIDLKKKEFLDEVFDYYYSLNDYKFNKLIFDFSLKDDNSIKKDILRIYNTLSLYIDKDLFLDGYTESSFGENAIRDDLSKYLSLLKSKIDSLRELIEELSYLVDSSYIEKLESVLYPLFNSNSYEDIRNYSNIKIPILRNASIEGKDKKEEISSLIKEINSLCNWENTLKIEESILKTKDYVEVIIDILKNLDIKLSNYKRENDLYEFQDIALLSIKVLEDNPLVKDELKNYFNEIMIDEYQDTSDIQEYFIKLIENNNVYMVGDIKQSIYRFRNANPYIFKNKYDLYSKNIGGIKIDLNKNFRTRKEAIDDINIIFNDIMDDIIGGADYLKSHNLVFGNMTYEENKREDQNNNLEVYTYPYDKDTIFSKEEIEAFIIGNDIKRKIDNNFQILDKNTNLLRDVKYSDFVILMDRATNFNLYKKIFEYLNIPLRKYTDENIIDKYDILIMKNIINLIISIKKELYDTSFRYSFTSVGRSYLFEYSDEEIFDYLTNNTFYNSSLFKKAKDISYNIDSENISHIIELIINRFSFYKKINKMGNVRDTLMRLEYLYNLGNNLSSLGYTIYDFSSFIDNLITDQSEIKVSIKEDSLNSVNIMTIHKSKGLEYGVCYYAGLSNKFNIKDINDRFLLTNRKFITPYFDEGIRSTIYKSLLKESYIKEEISEKIRLFYVALTRCREKMIILLPESSYIEKEPLKLVSQLIRYKYRSFADIMNSVLRDLESYVKKVNLEEEHISRNYALIKKNNYEENIPLSSEKIDFINLNLSFEEYDNEHFSKKIDKLITKKEKETLEFGSYMHYLLELADFKNKDISFLNVKEPYYTKIMNFMNNKIFDNVLNSKIYKEYAFSYQKDGNLYSGIIDLMIEDQDRILIVDYKLKNIDDPAYLKQLEGYFEYIKSKSSKEIHLYLYSIITEELKKIK